MKEIQKITSNYIMKILHELELYYFSPNEISSLFDFPKVKTYEILRHLKHKGLIQSLESGKYLLLGFQPERVLSNTMFVASRVANPGYISFWSALNYYGLTEQVPKTVFVVTTKKRKKMIFNDSQFIFVKVLPSRFFGYRKVVIGGFPVLMADIEKAIIDSLNEPDYAGGFLEVAKSLYQGLPKIKMRRLIKYANLMGNLSVCSRLGYLLEQYGIYTKGLKISGTYVLLDPGSRAEGSYDHKWRIRVNIPKEKLFEWRGN